MSSIAPFYLRERPEKSNWRRVLEFPESLGKLVSEYVGYGENQ